MKQKEQLARHIRKCDLQQPPGDEIYRQGSLSVFEVDGKKYKIYGQNLCYLTRLFLDHKNLDFDVHNFLFYILCECNDRGCHMVGYFSKDKFSSQRSRQEYNVACILTLPPYPRKGYGNFLIAFSYELSKKEGIVGSPEKPLSDLGKASYMRYWTCVLVGVLEKLPIKRKVEGNISIKELSEITTIHVKDIEDTLLHLNILQYRKGSYILYMDLELLTKHLKVKGRCSLSVDPSKLVWTPYKK